MTTQLTEAQFKEALPKGVQKRVNPAVINNINKVLANSEIAEELRDNIIGFSSVLRDGKYRMESYLNAVKYVSYKMMGGTQKQAYTKTFPDKMNNWKVLNVSEKDISKYLNIYNKSQLVQAITEQSLTPSYILNADVFQEAINVNKSIMLDLDVSPKTRVEAANSILNHLKRPEAQKVELDIGISDNSIIAGLAEATNKLADQMHRNIETGVANAKDIAQQKIIDVEHEVIDEA